MGAHFFKGRSSGGNTFAPDENGGPTGDGHGIGVGAIGREAQRLGGEFGGAVPTEFGGDGVSGYGAYFDEGGIFLIGEETRERGGFEAAFQDLHGEVGGFVEGGFFGALLA